MSTWDGGGEEMWGQRRAPTRNGISPSEANDRSADGDSEEKGLAARKIKNGHLTVRVRRRVVRGRAEARARFD